MVTISDKEIIIKIKQGEINYFSFLVKKYTDRIYYVIYSRLFNKDDVDDLVQNAFLDFYKAINRFNEDRPVLPYLYEIAKNETKMYFRSKKETVSLDESIKTVNHKEENNFLSTDIEELLTVLPVDQKKALKLLSEGYSYEEIAQKLSRPLNTVRTIIRRGRLKIKKNYEKT